MFNTDEKSILIPQMIEISLPKEIKGAFERFVRPALKQNRNIDHVTVMSVMSASANKLKPAIICTEMQQRIWKVNGRDKTVYQYLADYYV